MLEDLNEECLSNPLLFMPAAQGDIEADNQLLVNTLLEKA